MNNVVEILHVQKFFGCLPTNLKRINISSIYCYSNLSFVENAFVKKIIIDTRFPFQYGKINCVKALSTFSSLNFDMDSINDKMFAIKEYVESNGGVINTITNVRFYRCFNYQNITNMLTLLTYFPNLDNIEVRFNDSCDASINDDEIRQLF